MNEEYVFKGVDKNLMQWMYEERMSILLAKESQLSLSQCFAIYNIQTPLRNSVTMTNDRNARMK